MTEAAVSERLYSWLRRVAAIDHGTHRLEPLSRGPSSVLYSVEGHRASSDESLVLRMITNRQWLSECPHLVYNEAQVLGMLAGTAVPAPRLVAFEADAREFGLPIILMTKLAGHPVRRDLRVATDRLRRMASMLRRIHQVPLAGTDAVLQSYVPHYLRRSLRITPPIWSAETSLWEEAIAWYRAWSPASGPETFLHRDYHSGNILWRGAEISGVVDWITACRGHPLYDVGHCRLNLTLSHGCEAADLFTRHYLEADPMGCEGGYDLVAVVGALPDLKPGDVRQVRRMETFMEQALRRVG